MADAIGVKALGYFRKQHLLARRPPGACHARLRVDNDFVGVDRPRFKERDQRKFGARRVAAGIGDEPRGLDLGPVDLG
jgi:hypothetical protein